MYDWLYVSSIMMCSHLYKKVIYEYKCINLFNFIFCITELGTTLLILSAHLLFINVFFVIAFAACFCGHGGAISVLLAKGADKNKPDNLGETPLTACDSAVKHLLEE